MRSESGAPSAPRDPLVFAVGCPRSGTTLLQRILDNHPALAVANDTHFVPRCLKRWSRAAHADALAGRDVPLTRELVAVVRGYRRFERLGIGDAAVERAAVRSATYAQFVGALYEELAEIRGKRHGGEKTPDYVRNLPLLHALFPASRFVHIVRDGRDVALSLLEWSSPQKGPGKLAYWSVDPLAVAILWWRWQVLSGRDAARDLSLEVYCEIDYDAMVLDPAAHAVELCAFLGLDYEPTMVAYHEGKVRDDAGLNAKDAWLPPTTGLRDWRTQLSRDDQALFELLAGDLRNALGHEPGCADPSSSVLRRAAESRAWFDGELRRKAQKDAREDDD